MERPSTRKRSGVGVQILLMNMSYVHASHVAKDEQTGLPGPSADDLALTKIGIWPHLDHLDPNGTTSHNKSTLVAGQQH